MNNTIQLYMDENEEIEGYPITSPDRVIDENGITIKEQLDNIDIETKKINKISKLVYKKDHLSWAESIQGIENEANELYKSMGVKVRLKFPENEIIEIDKTIYKKSGVDWVGSCKLKRTRLDTTHQWALVVANQESDFIIDNINFENLEHEIAYKIPGHWSVDVRNCCIHTYKCSDFSIINCNLTKYSEGIVNTACKRYSILNNVLNSKVNGRDINQFLDDSYNDIAGAQTGDITSWVLSNEANLYNEDFIISNNKCLSVGLRMGIEIMTQSATHARGIISNNIIKGLHHGIKLYKGTWGQLDNAVTNIKQCIISNNQISYCRDIGIYIRANLGVLCNGNFISYCGLEDTGAGTAYGGIVTRISAELTDSNSTIEAGNFIVNNYIYNCGKSTGSTVTPIGIQVRNANCNVISNFIVQDSSYTEKLGVGIYGGLGDTIPGAVIKNNTIINFNDGIRLDSSTTNFEKSNLVSSNNEIKKCKQGIAYDLFNGSSTPIIKGNNISVDEIGIVIRRCLNSIISENVMSDSKIGIQIAAGCFLDNVNRTGPTSIVRDNLFKDVTTPHSVKEVAPGDISFKGRCLYWGNDLVNGVLTPS